ncbi:uncharacterized protein LOC121943484 [Plectropomus leopardus]|uniref:uncharacterized protein LOC121943484 n=1 Tax=Plectropomus leopardus TaxID=160734 RepID=UPI001C4C6455|nr:uncharacterized protein LOC121943484 [Plectropomus leopardus]
MAQPSGACCEAKWVRGHLSGSVEANLHVTVRRQSDGRMPVVPCKDCKLYHCPYCKPSIYKPKEDYAKVWTHVEIHRMRALQHGEFNIHVCQLPCRAERHYHCPYCPNTLKCRKQFESHMDKCLEAQKTSAAAAAKGTLSDAPPGTSDQLPTTVGQGTFLLLNVTAPFPQTIMMGSLAPLEPSAQPKSTENPAVEIKHPSGQCPATSDTPAQPKSTADPPAEPKCTSNQCLASLDGLDEPTTTAPAAPPDLPVSTLTENPVKQTGQISQRATRRIKCPMCNLYLHKKNLRKHKLRKHFNQTMSEKDITVKDHLRSQCIDSHNGVYAVAKSYKATAVPIHVIKKRSDSTHKMVCGEDRCEAVSDFRRRSGLPNSQCSHLQSVDFCFTRAKKEDLKPCLLENLISSKWIGKDMGAKCLKHQEKATQNRAPLVTLVDLGGSHCLFLSVFAPEVLQHKVGRLFVTYTMKRGLWHCECSQGRISCLHKSLAKWYLFQTNKELFTSDAKGDAKLCFPEFMEDVPEETTEVSSGTLYPLREERLKEMAKYIYDQKKLPPKFPEDIPLCESELDFPKHLVPAQTVCPECPGGVYLTEPVLITNKARVITLTGAMEDNSTFFKQCPDCEMVYHYQEWSEGLHNYNNHIILSLQLCMLLQNLIKNHSAVDGVVEVLERTVGVKSPLAMEVLQGYLHFEALTNHDCLSVVMMDLYQKGVFNMAGFEITGLSESCTGEINAEEVWDSVCMEIIRSSLVARGSSFVSTSDVNLKEAAVSAVTVFPSPADRKKLSKQRIEECHRAVIRYLVKGLHPLFTVESPAFREMTKMLNPKYQLPSRDQLINTLMPSWYSAEKKRIIKELLQVSQAAVTCDWWTSSVHDHYLTVTLHFIVKGQMKHKVLRTKPVYDAQTDTAVAEQICKILEEFGVRDKVVVVTLDNSSSMDIAIKKSQLRKLRCFAQVLNVAAQKVYTSIAVTRWASRIRAVVVWIQRSSTAQKILQEKQQLLNLPQHSLVLDVRRNWSSFYLMMERFAEQYAAIQATTTDPQITQSDEWKRLEMFSDDDHQKAEEFMRIMKPMYTSSLCVSADKSPTCSQIFPILKKLTAHFETQDDDSLFTVTLKEKAWSDLSTCYRNDDTWKFLQEASAMDPRFKTRIDSDEIWYRVQNAAVRVTTTTEVSTQEEHRLWMEDNNADDVSEQNSDETLYPKRLRLTSLEELFEDEDRALKNITAAQKAPLAERVQQEIQLYRSLPAVPTSEDALAWWWRRRDSLPLLFQLSNMYLCIQASSTPHERVFSVTGDTISQERSHILPEHADMQIFLQKNC